MPKLIFSSEELSRYFNGQVKHKAYNETVKMALDLRIHAEGVYPKDMIEERRPSESLAVKAYRQKIWKPITKPTYSKVVTELNKIRRSAEWSVKYDDSKVPPRIAQEERMKAYCEENYPFFTSITNWLFKVLLPGYLKDANAVVAVMPLDPEKPLAANEYVRPFGYFYHSESVIDYVQDDYAVIKSTDKVLYQSAEGVKTFGDVYYIFTTQYIERWEQQGTASRYSRKWIYPHALGMLPVFRVEGLYHKVLDGTFIFNSRIDAMLPRLDDALREYGDLQAEVVQHVFNEKWEMSSDDCGKCKGKGQIKPPGFSLGDAEIICSDCEGSGVRSRGPYTKLMIKTPMAGESGVPVPPAGYIEKNVEIVKIQDERVDKHLFKALSAINMEYLDDSPLNQSGAAKEVDKDALNNFVHSVAEDLVAAMDKLYRIICEYRYRMVVPDAESRKGLLPYIAVPEKFDLLSITYLESQLSKQKENKGNPIITVAMEEDYVNKKFAGDNALKQRVLLSIKLDPLSGMSEDDKMVRLSNKGITEETYVVSCNIKAFIDRAIDEKGEAFFGMKLKEQKDLVLSYAKEQLQNSSTAAMVLSGEESESVNGGGGGNTLKGSVGGLTGMIEIAKAVASGLYDLEAAVALVSDRFGLTEEQARKQLGTPQLSNNEQQIDKVAKLT